MNTTTTTTASAPPTIEAPPGPFKVIRCAGRCGRAFTCTKGDGVDKALRRRRFLCYQCRRQPGRQLLMRLKWFFCIGGCGRARLEDAIHFISFGCPDCFPAATKRGRGRPAQKPPSQ